MAKTSNQGFAPDLVRIPLIIHPSGKVGYLKY